jgi:cysteine-rich secretory family protein
MPISPDISAAETAIIEMTNAFRNANNLPAVTSNPNLTAAARAYAKLLAAQKKDELSHTFKGTTPASRATKAGYDYCQIAENLALLYDSRGFSSAEYATRTLNGWQDSPGHRKNLLMPNVTETGVAVARTQNSLPRYIAVQLFGRPRSMSYSFEISNRSSSAVGYEYLGDSHEVKPRQIITHTSCDPGNIDFKLDPPRAAGRFEARDGSVYTLRPRDGGGVRVEVSR